MKETEKKKIFWGVLRDEWNKCNRYRYSDHYNINWLDGRKGLLCRLGMDKYIALKKLQQEKKEEDILC